MGQVASAIKELAKREEEELRNNNNSTPEKIYSRNNSTSKETETTINNNEHSDDDEPMNSAKHMTKKLILTESTLRKLVEQMDDEFNRGLHDDETAIVKMFLTFVRSAPKGDETGKYLALDLGGTNFRTLLVTLPSGKIESESHAIPTKLMEGTGDELFDHIADVLMNFIKQKGLKSGRYPLGFTFSFPCHQYGLSVAKLVRWTKGFKCSGVVGENVAKLLRDALRRYQERHPYQRSAALIDVVAVINDTTGTLMSCAHKNGDCKIGLIVGTGCNVCYFEKLEKIDKWPGNYSDVNQVIVNTEWGAFGEGGQLETIRTEADVNLDSASVNTTKQLYEKMISGMYLGEIVRQFMQKACSEKLIFSGQWPDSLAEKNSFSTKRVSQAESDENNDQLKRILTEKLNIENVTDTDLRIVRLICEQVSTRAAQLVAAGLVTIIERLGLKHVAIGYDGAVIKKHPKFLDRLTSQMKDLMGDKHSFELMLSEDGSGRGAAVVAAVTYREKRPLIVVRKDRKDGRLRKRVYELSAFSNTD
ncbi:Hexokinase type 2 [Halotydeus destructor]|nr:Hexokinase type 2 [Halotydeus destructor]